MLSFKQHALNTKAKVNTRNNLLRKLTNSRWGAHLATVRTTALALRFSTAEYACSSWGRSRNTGHVDITLNDTCRIITGCLTLSDFHFRNQNVLQGAIFFFWNQYSNIVRKKLSTTALTITVIIKKYTFYNRSINLLPIQV